MPLRAVVIRRKTALDRFDPTSKIHSRLRLRRCDGMGVSDVRCHHIERRRHAPGVRVHRQGLLHM
jgi:hypothetical protein